MTCATNREETPAEARRRWARQTTGLLLVKRKLAECKAAKHTQAALRGMERQ
jgi:hypothetical protein